MKKNTRKISQKIQQYFSIIIINGEAGIVWYNLLITIVKKLGLAATRFEIELCMGKDDSWMLSLH